MEACQFVIGYEREVPGSDVADPRIRCGEPATVQLDDGTWVCPEHAEARHASGGRESPHSVVAARRERDGKRVDRR